MSEWISVKNELPEEGDMVFVYWPSDYGGEIALDFIEDGCWSDWTELEKITETTNGDYCGEVPYTHWMRLPEPPNRILN